MFLVFRVFLGFKVFRVPAKEWLRKKSPKIRLWLHLASAFLLVVLF